jgi:hemerythrin-like domain-containing protein
MKPTEDLINEHKAIKVMLGIMGKIAENIKNDKRVDTNDVEEIVDFLQIFADKCHHGKEEKVLFPALEAAGIPNENGPIGVMLNEHIIGRSYIREIGTANENYKTGNTESVQLIADSLSGYVDLLQNHILKEENVLFKMADKVLGNKLQDDLYEQFEKIEEEVVGHGVHEQFHELLKQLKSKYP